MTNSVAPPPPQKKKKKKKRTAHVDKIYQILLYFMWLHLDAEQLPSYFLFSQFHSLLHIFATVGDEAFLGKFSCFWAGDLPPPSCSHGCASVECVPMDTTRSLHLFSASFFERWVSKSVCPWSDVFFTSASETDFFFPIFCHTMGTDEECDLYIYIYRVAQKECNKFDC